MATIREAAGDLWRDREADIKAAVAPWRGLIDEIDTIAYLAADAHGQPPISSNSGARRMPLPPHVCVCACARVHARCCR